MLILSDKRLCTRPFRVFPKLRPDEARTRDRRYETRWCFNERRDMPVVISNVCRLLIDSPEDENVGTDSYLMVWRAALAVDRLFVVVSNMFSASFLFVTPLHLFSPPRLYPFPSRRCAFVPKLPARRCCFCHDFSSLFPSAMSNAANRLKSKRSITDRRDKYKDSQRHRGCTSGEMGKESGRGDEVFWPRDREMGHTESWAAQRRVARQQML